jgi:DNA ligase (NAD+)
MDILVGRLIKANEAYRNGLTLLMTDDEYDSGIEQLAKQVPNHPFLKKTRAAPVSQKTVKMPYYLGSLNKAKVADDLTKWLQKTTPPYCVSEKLDGISGLWNPTDKKLYLSGDDNTGLDVSAWLKYMSLSPSVLASDIPNDIWIRGELIMVKTDVPSGRLGRSIVNGIFHHATPNPVEAAKVRFVAYEVIGLDQNCTTKQQFAWLELWGMWIPWYSFSQFNPDSLTQILNTRRSESPYDMDGLVLKTNIPLPRITKGNPGDAIAWKPANGETKLTKVVQVEWNASPTGRLIPRVEIEPVNLGGSVIKHVTGVHARRVTDWKIGPGATVIVRKGGDVIPVIDSVNSPAAVVFPPADTWEWDGDETTAVHIKQKVADTTTITALYMRMVTRLGWENMGPALMKAVVDAGYTTVPLLRAATEADLKKLVGPVKGAHLYKTVQGEGWAKASELDLFVASPICPSGIGKTRLEALLVSESDVSKWTSTGLVAPKGWSVDALRDFQKVWAAYEDFRKKDWAFIPYPRILAAAPVAAPVAIKGSVVFSGFRDAVLEASLAAKGYKLVDNVKSDTKAVLIADTENPETYTSTKIEKAKKVPGCSILRRADWRTL